MSISNTAPSKMTILSSYSSYTKVYLSHAIYADRDAVGKNWWVYDSVNTLLTSTKDLSKDSAYTVLDNFLPNTLYKIEGSYYDQMIDDALLAARFGINISDLVTVTTRQEPQIQSISIISEQLDVGVGMPYVVFDISGDADYITIEYSKTGMNSWASIYTGRSGSDITVPVAAGVYDFRVRGFIILPDGQTTDTSSYTTITNQEVNYQFSPPSTPTGITFGVVHILDGIERYDLKVSWDWEKAAGATAKEFVLYYVSQAEYNISQWSKASVINTGTALSSVITGFTFNKPYIFKVKAISWGPDGSNSSESSSSTFTIDSNTAIDHAVTVDTAIEVTYAHIKAFATIGGVKTQTFLVDAQTGSMAIGALVAGNAPITVNGLDGTVNIDGSVVTDTIYSASFVLSNLTGEDNPHIRSAGKAGYGTGTGFWTGYDNLDSVYKWDIGDSSQYMRWDGSTLRISGNVVVGTPTGDVPLGNIGSASRSSSFYVQPLTPFVGWSDTEAALFFTNNFAGEPSEYDVLTQFDSSDPNNSSTKQYIEGVWTTPVSAMHGNMVVDGTLTTAKMVANSAFVNEIGTEIIYDRDAALSGDPETNFKMKIDLVSGSITIR